MTIEKVNVTKEVADAIEFLRMQHNYEFPDFMRAKTQGDWEMSTQSLPLNDLPIETLAKVLINGYVVEKTPEEKVRDYYDRCTANTVRAINANSEHFNRGQAIGTAITLDILGIKVKGVNA